jgi:hypothetical protein
MLAHACRRAAFTAAVIRSSARLPPTAVSFSVRHVVGTDATGPNSSFWSPLTQKSHRLVVGGDHARQVAGAPVISTVGAAYCRHHDRRGRRIDLCWLDHP